MKAKLMKWGNSLAVRIPKPLISEARLKDGDSLEIEACEGQLRLRRVTRRPAPTLSQLVDQITPENRYGEISVGTDVGKERVEW
jgi:antitoxin MazE